jgi:predicted phage terminase large subunit-like protein
MQNDPSGMGGNVFKRDWFTWVDAVPAGARRVGLDLAASKSERSDYTAAVEVVEDAERNLYFVGAFAARLDEGHRRWLTGRDDTGGYIETVGDNPPGPRLAWPVKMLPSGFCGASGYPEVARQLTALNIEATQHQSTFVREMLRETRLPAVAFYPDADKVTRARTLAARFESRKVFFLRGGPGLGTGPTDPGDFVRQLLAFPNGEHDDQVDAGVYAADLGSNDFYFTSASR